MKKLYGIIFVVFLVLIFFISPLKSPFKGKINTPVAKMKQIWPLFYKLVELASDEQKFINKENEEKILKLNSELTNSLYAINNTHSRFSSSMDAEARLFLFNRKLEDAKKLFKHGKKKKALHLFREISSNCVGCHLENNVFPNSIPRKIKNKHLSAIVKAEYSLIFMQYREAEQHYATAIQNTKDYSIKIDALLKWLQVVTRYLQDPEFALEKLKKFKKLEWQSYEYDMISQWIESLENWKNVDLELKAPIGLAKQYFGPINMSFDTFGEKNSAVDLLIIAGLLDNYYRSNPPLSPRLQSLQYLALIHLKLPAHFVNKTAEPYLERCILEASGRAEGKTCYEIYREIIALYPESSLLNSKEYLEQLYNMGFYNEPNMTP